MIYEMVSQATGMTTETSRRNRWVPKLVAYRLALGQGASRSREVYCTTTLAQDGARSHAAGELTLTVIGIPATKLALTGPVSFAKTASESFTLAEPLLTVMTAFTEQN